MPRLRKPLNLVVDKHGNATVREDRAKLIGARTALSAPMTEAEIQTAFDQIEHSKKSLTTLCLTIPRPIREKLSKRLTTLGGELSLLQFDLIEATMEKK